RPSARREALWKTHRSYFTQLLNEPVPMLDGLTPRTAAQDLARRPQLTEFLKAHLHHLDTVNRRDGLDLDIDWVLDELGFPGLRSPFQAFRLSWRSPVRSFWAIQPLHCIPGLDVSAARQSQERINLLVMHQGCRQYQEVRRFLAAVNKAGQVDIPQIMLPR